MAPALVVRHHKNSENSDRLVCEKEAANVLSLSPRTLQGWRVRGGGPKYIKFGTKAIRYSLSELLKFIERQTRSHTSANEVSP
jgi:predicted DNA-binding transcriptional regulator AlpA